MAHFLNFWLIFYCKYVAQFVVHLLKDTLVASSFWQLWIKDTSFWIDKCFQISKVNNLEEFTVSYGNIMFRFARSCQIYSQSGCKILNSYQKWMKVYCSAFLPVIDIISILDFSHSRTFVVISYSFNLQFSDNKNIHLFICLLATYISLLVRHLFESFAHSKFLLIFFLLNFNNSFIFWIPIF